MLILGGDFGNNEYPFPATEFLNSKVGNWDSGDLNSENWDFGGSLVRDWYY